MQGFTANGIESPSGKAEKSKLFHSSIRFSSV